MNGNAEAVSARQIDPFGRVHGGQLVTGLLAIRRIRRVRAIGLRLRFSHDVAVFGQPLQASGGPVR